jgi:ADP-ribosylglycohydrolase
VVDSVPLSLYAVRSIERTSLDDVLRSAIEAGGDTDTIASMTGQIAGAWLGGSRIAPQLIELLPHHLEIERIVSEFMETITSP